MQKFKRFFYGKILIKRLLIILLVSCSSLNLVACNNDSLTEVDKPENKLETISDLIKRKINEKFEIYNKNNNIQFRQFKNNDFKNFLASEYKKLENNDISSIKLNNEEFFNSFKDLIKFENYIKELNYSLKNIPSLENIDNIISIDNDTSLNLTKKPEKLIGVLDDILKPKKFALEANGEGLVYIINFNFNFNINFNNRIEPFNNSYDFFLNDWVTVDGKLDASYLSQSFTDNDNFLFKFTSLNITENQLKKFLLENLGKLTKNSNKNLMLVKILNDPNIRITLSGRPEYGTSSQRQIVIDASRSTQFINIARITIKFATVIVISQYDGYLSSTTITFGTYKNFETDVRNKLKETLFNIHKSALFEVINDENVKLSIEYIRFSSSLTARIKLDANQNSKKFTGIVYITFTVKINDMSAKYSTFSTTSGLVKFSSLKDDGSLYVTGYTNNQKVKINSLYLLDKTTLNKKSIQDFDSEIVGLEVNADKNWYVATKNKKLYSGKNGTVGTEIASFDENISKITLYDKNNLYIVTENKKLYSYNLDNKTKNFIHSFESDITKVYVNKNQYYVGLANGDLYYGESNNKSNKIQTLRAEIVDIALDKINNLYVITKENLYGGSKTDLKLIQNINKAASITFDSENNWYVGTSDSYGKIYSGNELSAGKYFLDVYDPISNLKFSDGNLVVANNQYVHKIEYDFGKN